MANTIELPNLKFFQWQRPGAGNPRLEIGIGLNDTTIVCSNPPLDENGNVITGDFVFGVRNIESYVENIYVPPGEVSVDGLTFTNVVRGVNLTGLDYNTSVPSLIAKHGADSPVSCNVTAVYESILAACLRGQTVRTNGVDFILGTGTPETVNISRDDGTVRGWLRYSVADGVQYSNDGSSYINLSPGASGSLVAITNADTSPGFLDDKVVVTSNNPVLSIQTNVLNPGGGEDLEIEVDLDTVVVSAGVADADKVVVTDATGKIDASLLEVKDINVVTFSTASGTPVTKGSATSRYDVTKIGNTITYTWDGTGTNPNITSGNVPIGSVVNTFLSATTLSALNAVNKGIFVVTNAGTNFFEVTNASGIAENDKIMILSVVTTGVATYTKPANLAFIKVQVQAGGDSGTSANQANSPSLGGFGGNYTESNIAASDLSATEKIVVAAQAEPIGPFAVNNQQTLGNFSSFGNNLFYASDGRSTNNTGDFLFYGRSRVFFNENVINGARERIGGDSFLGRADNTPSNTVTPAGIGIGFGAGGEGVIAQSGSVKPGGIGTQGVVIITEYFI